MKKLYDFSIAAAVMTLAAYALLLFLFGFTWYTGGNPYIYGTVFVLLLFSFLFILWYFVVMAPRLEPDGLHQGARFIPKEKLIYKVFYNVRFKEIQIRLRNDALDYRSFNSKLKKKKEIYVQATPANLRKLGAWLGCEIVIPEDAKPKRRRRAKK